MKRLLCVLVLITGCGKSLVELQAERDALRKAAVETKVSYDIANLLVSEEGKKRAAEKKALLDKTVKRLRDVEKKIEAELN